MNDDVIVPIFVVIDEVMTLLATVPIPRRVPAIVILPRGHPHRRRRRLPVPSAQRAPDHERALCVMHALHYLSGDRSVSRFNRRLHALADWLPLLLDLLGEVLAKGEAFVIDSMPLPVCQRARASRCRKVRGAVYCGDCAAKQEKFFGWRLHLIVTPTGMPVSFEILPASLHRVPACGWHDAGT